jgi:hypothetical protein
LKEVSRVPLCPEDVDRHLQAIEPLANLP